MQHFSQKTFDPPLFLKATIIKVNNGDEFKDIHVRLGGFHQLMSFLGSGGKLFDGGGIEDIWKTVYAPKSIPRMLEGKAYNECLRTWLSTDIALHAAMLQSHVIERYDEDILDNYVNNDNGNIFSIFSQWEDEVIDEYDKIEINKPAVSSEDFQDVYVCVETNDTNENDMLSGSSITSLPKPLLNNCSEASELLLTHEISEDDERVLNLLDELYHAIKVMKEEFCISTTARYLMMFVSIVRLFIRAECTGNRNLALKVSEDICLTLQQGKITMPNQFAFTFK